MNGERGGPITPGHPLYPLLSTALHTGDSGDFESYALGREGAVFLYVHGPTTARAVGKFYGRKSLPADVADTAEMRGLLLRREFRHLELLRSLGFDDGPHRVPRPLLISEPHDWLLIEEFVPGENLHSAVRKWIAGSDLLERSITGVAAALALMHHAVPPRELLPPKDVVVYFAKVIGQLQGSEVVSDRERERLVVIARRWHANHVLSDYRPVMIHGDATPEHFLYDDATGRMYVIDAEALRLGDPAEDLGYLAGELKHLFWMYTGDPWASERLIRHLYDAYGHTVRMPSSELGRLTERARYFMGIVEMRIARNAWLPFRHRVDLVAEAERCLSL